MPCTSLECLLPGEGLFDERDPHLVGIDWSGAPRQARVDTDREVVVDVDVVPATESPEPTVKHSVVLGRPDTIRFVRQDLHVVSNTLATADITIYLHDTASTTLYTSTRTLRDYDKELTWKLVHRRTYRSRTRTWLVPCYCDHALNLHQVQLAAVADINPIQFNPMQSFISHNSSYWSGKSEVMEL